MGTGTTRILASLLFLLLSSCATESGTGTSISGSSIVFTYETGDADVILNLPDPQSRKMSLRTSRIFAGVLLFDRDPLTGKRGQATSLDTGVTVTLPENVSFTLPNCSANPTLVDTVTAETYRLFTYEYPSSCTLNPTDSISATATVIAHKNGASKTLIGSGSGSSGGGGGGAALSSHTIFVTSTSHTGNLGGLSGADSICQTRAAAGSVTSGISGGTWKALLSASGSSAASRIDIGDVPIYDTTGSPVILIGTNLWNGFLFNAAKYDENGSELVDNAWTGSTSAGATNTDTCNDWTSSLPAVNGEVGVSSAIDSLWISDGFLDCSTTNSLYCINSN